MQSLSRGVCGGGVNGYEVWGGAPESPLSMGPERPRYATDAAVNRHFELTLDSTPSRRRILRYINFGNGES